MFCIPSLSRLLLVIAPLATLGGNVVRRVAVDSRAMASVQLLSDSKSFTNQSKAKQGLAFWRAMRKNIETRRHSASSRVHETSVLSPGARRDILWQTVREVDKFQTELGNGPKCTLEEARAYMTPQKLIQAGILENHAAHINQAVTSARECSLMCAAISLGADSLGDGAHPAETSCKSFMYNETAKECMFLNNYMAHEGVKDKCCTSGPPCNLAKMRKEIQVQFFRAMEHAVLVKNQGSAAATAEKAAKQVAESTSADPIEIPPASLLAKSAGTHSVQAESSRKQIPLLCIEACGMALLVSLGLTYRFKRESNKIA